MATSSARVWIAKRWLWMLDVASYYVRALVPAYVRQCYRVEDLLRAREASRG